jgi:hypothetical protein
LNGATIHLGHFTSKGNQGKNEGSPQMTLMTQVEKTSLTRATKQRTKNQESVSWDVDGRARVIGGRIHRFGLAVEIEAHLAAIPLPGSLQHFGLFG